MEINKYLDYTLYCNDELIDLAIEVFDNLTDKYNKTEEFKKEKVLIDNSKTVWHSYGQELESISNITEDLSRSLESSPYSANRYFKLLAWYSMFPNPRGENSTYYIGRRRIPFNNGELYSIDSAISFLNQFSNIINNLEPSGALNFDEIKNDYQTNSTNLEDIEKRLKVCFEISREEIVNKILENFRVKIKEVAPSKKVKIEAIPDKEFKNKEDLSLETEKKLMRIEGAYESLEKELKEDFLKENTEDQKTISNNNKEVKIETLDYSDTEIKKEKYSAGTNFRLLVWTSMYSEPQSGEASTYQVSKHIYYYYNNNIYSVTNSIEFLEQFECTKNGRDIFKINNIKENREILGEEETEKRLKVCFYINNDQMIQELIETYRVNVKQKTKKEDYKTKPFKVENIDNIDFFCNKRISRVAEIALGNVKKEFGKLKTETNREEFIKKEINSVDRIRKLLNAGENGFEAVVEFLNNKIEEDPNSMNNFIRVLAWYSVFKDPETKNSVEEYILKDNPNYLILFFDLEIFSIEQSIRFLKQFESTKRSTLGSLFMINRIEEEFNNLSKTKEKEGNSGVNLLLEDLEKRIKVCFTQTQYEVITELTENFINNIKEDSKLKPREDLILDNETLSMFYYKPNVDKTKQDLNYTYLESFNARWKNFIEKYRNEVEKSELEDSNKETEKLKALKERLIGSKKSVIFKIEDENGYKDKSFSLYREPFGKDVQFDKIVEDFLKREIYLNENESFVNFVTLYSLLNIYDFNNITIIKNRSNDNIILEAPSIKKDKKTLAEIEGETLNYSELYSLLKDKIDEFLENLRREIIESRELKEKIRDKEASGSSFREYEKSRLINDSKFEKDFFYIEKKDNKKMVPSNFSPEIKFCAYSKDIEDANVNNIEYIWVTHKENEIRKESPFPSRGEIYSDNYFSSMEIVDEGGVRKISLNLESVDDLNLETIILRTLKLKRKGVNGILSKIAEKNEGEFNISSELLADIKYDFMVKFGYTDKPANSSSVINPSNIDDPSFSNRIKDSKPVIKSPWIGFKITGLTSSLVNNRNTFTIEGIESSGYLIDNLCLALPSGEKSKSANYTARGVINKIGEYLSEASNNNILILSDEPEKLVYGNKKMGQKVNFGNGAIPISDFDFDDFYNSEKISSKEKSFSFYEEEELEENSLPTIRNLLNKLCDNFLPSRYYEFIEVEKNGKVRLMANKVSYKNIKDKNKIRVENPKFEILKRESTIEGIKKERTFIRIYYDGPYLIKEDAEFPDLRIYNYKNYNRSVTKNISITSNVDFGIASAAVTIIKDGENTVFSPSEIDIDDGGVTVKLFGTKQEDSFLILKDNYKYVNFNEGEDHTGETEKDEDKDASKTEADLMFDALTNYPYKGEVEILGDPFYLFDSLVSPYRYEIYLNISKSKTVLMNEISDSFYSGIYVVSKITHSMNKEEFITTLEVLKKTIG